LFICYGRLNDGADVDLLLLLRTFGGVVVTICVIDIVVPCGCSFIAGNVCYSRYYSDVTARYCCLMMIVFGVYFVTHCYYLVVVRCCMTLLFVVIWYCCWYICC
jgi:hypothetical protein